MIVAVALGLGFGLGTVPEILASMPEWVKLLFGESGIVVASMVALALNAIFPKDDVVNINIAKETKAIDK